MTTTSRRRTFTAALLAGLAINTLCSPLEATAEPINMRSDQIPERSLGKIDAPYSVTEYFSLTCIHCAAFQKNIFPKIKSELIETGKLRYTFKEFPLDRLALAGSMIARTLPEEKYVPFIEALLSTQDGWAFNKENPKDKLIQQANFAGMSKEEANQAINNIHLEKAILNEEESAQKKWDVRSTPTFIFSSGQKITGETDFEKFKKAMTGN